MVSEDGLIMASSLPRHRGGASCGDECGIAFHGFPYRQLELKRGQLEQVFVKGDSGFVVIMQAGPHAVLTAMHRKDAKLRPPFLDMNRTARYAREGSP